MNYYDFYFDSVTWIITQSNMWIDTGISKKNTADK